jgi:hypothetical protein
MKTAEGNIIGGAWTGPNCLRKHRVKSTIEFTVFEGGGGEFSAARGIVYFL